MGDSGALGIAGEKVECKTLTKTHRLQNDEKNLKHLKRLFATAAILTLGRTVLKKRSKKMSVIND